MSSPILWMLVPGLLSAPLFLMRRWRRVTTISGMAVTLLLAWLAWLIPVGEPFPYKLWPTQPSFALAESLAVLGRQFVLTNAERPLLTMVFLAISLWFLGGFSRQVTGLLVPFGLAIAALLVASLAVRPFLYAALIIEIASILCVPILSPPGSPPSRGVLRFLVYQALGMPFLLLAGWFINNLNPEIPGAMGAIQIFFVIGLGFSLLLGIFPFHSWLPMLAEESQPYAAGFVFFLIPTGIAFFEIAFLKSYSLIRMLQIIYIGLNWLGIFMVLLGGIGAIFQTHLGRIFGFAIMVEIGISLLSLSLLGDDPLFINGVQPYTPVPATLLSIFFVQILPRCAGLTIWAHCLSQIRAKTGSLNLSEISGIGWRMPFITITMLLAAATIGGLPLLAGFPAKLSLWTTLAKQSGLAAPLALIGSAGLMISLFRIIRSLFAGNRAEFHQIDETVSQAIVLIVACIILVGIGVWSHPWYTWLEDVSRAFIIYTP